MIYEFLAVFLLGVVAGEGLLLVLLRQYMEMRDNGH